MIKRNRFLAVIIVAIFIAALASFGFPSFLKSSLEKNLARHGLNDVTVTSIGRDNGELMFSDIWLDADGFSQIGTIRVRTDWAGLFTSAPLFSHLIIDDLNILGSIDENGTISIGGWRPLPALSAYDVQKITVNSAQIDLSTPEGGIRLNAKGNIEFQSKDEGKAAFALWGKQHQLVLDSRINIALKNQQIHTIGIDLRSLRLNTDAFKLSRGSGWASMEKDEDADNYNISAQLDVGQANLGENTLLNDTTITALGSYLDPHIIIKGTLPFYNMSLSIDIKGDVNDRDIQIISKGKTPQDIVTFLDNIGPDLQLLPFKTIDLTPLLLTEGNIKRLQSEFKKAEYENVFLTLRGSPYDLSGKITASNIEDGVNKQTVVSINPGQ